MNKEKINFALTRAGHAVWETAAATLPATLAITPQMIKEFDINIIYAVIAWILTALFAGVISFIKSMAAGMPEVDMAESIYMDVEEPEDSFIGDGEICESIYTKEEAEKDGEK